MALWEAGTKPLCSNHIVEGDSEGDTIEPLAAQLSGWELNEDNLGESLLSAMRTNQTPESYLSKELCILQVFDLHNSALKQKGREKNKHLNTQMILAINLSEHRLRVTLSGERLIS